MGLKENWIRLIYKVATGSRRLRLFLTPVVGLSYFLFASLFVVAAFFCDGIFDLPKFPPAPVHLLVSIPFITFGLLLMGWSVFSFLRVKGTPVPINPPSELVTTGPYAHVRNPMLGGIFLFLFGLALYFRSLALLFFFTPLFILINVVELKWVEEPELEMRLGPTYRRYKEKTPMFFPIKTVRFK